MVYAVFTNRKGRVICTRDFNTNSELESHIDTMLARGYLRGEENMDEARDETFEVVVPVKKFGEFMIALEGEEDGR